MSDIKLVLVDRDACFLEKLSAYIRKSKANHFQMELFTQPSVFEKWYLEDGKADLIAISSTAFHDLTVRPDQKNAVLLVDGPQSLIPQGFSHIEKYQPAEALIREFLSFCSDSMPQMNQKKAESKKIRLVLYLDGSDVLNPLAQSLALLLSQKGYASFYLSLDHIPGTPLYFSGSNQKGMSEMIYYVKSRKENLDLKAEACSSRDLNTGIGFMKPHQNLEDTANLDGAEIKAMIDAILGRDLYEGIIISREFRFDDIQMSLMEQASCLYLTFMDYPTSYERLKAALRAIKHYDERNGLRLSEKVVLCVSGISSGNPPLPPELPDFKSVCLPSSYPGSGFFPPSGDYLSALEALV